MIIFRRFSGKCVGVFISNLDTEIENIKNLFSQTPEMFCILSGTEHIFEYVNHAHIKALGFDATGMKVREAQPESIEIHGILDDVYRTGITASLHEIPVTLGTSLRYFDLTYAAKKDRNGNPNGIMVLGAEVTNRVLIDQKIALERKRMFDFFEQIPAAVAVLSNNDFTFELANSSYKNLVGTKRDLIGKPLSEAIPDLDPSFNKILTGVVETGERFIAQEFPLTIDWHLTGVAELKYISFFYEPLKNDYGKVEGVLVFVYDVTEQMIARERVNTALKVRDEFLSIASHELKTPLTSLNLQIQSSQRKIAKGASDDFSLEKLEDLFSKYKKQTDRLIRLVDDMLDLSKINLGKLSFNFKEVNLNSIIETSYENLKEQFENKNSRLSFKISSEPTIGLFDPERIEQVVTNLLTNALKYGEGKPVSITIVKNKNMARIHVRDEGLGIPSENFDIIFQKFERVPPSSSLQISGLGIGLFISKEIVEAHRGKVWVESEMGVGSTFIVELPLNR